MHRVPRVYDLKSMVSSNIERDHINEDGIRDVVEVDEKIEQGSYRGCECNIISTIKVNGNGSRCREPGEDRLSGPLDVTGGR